MIRLAITDDHSLIRSGIAAMLEEMPELLIVGSYANASETLENIKKDAPDVLLLDINLPDTNGIELCKPLIRLLPDLKILALSNHEDTSFVKKMLAQGAHGYLLKNTHRLELITAMKAVLAGEDFLQPQLKSKMLDQLMGKKTRDPFFPKLTRRELEVLSAIAQELTTQEIADKLFISTKTVETHRMNLLSKLGAKNSVGLIRIAMEKGLIGEG